MTTFFPITKKIVSVLLGGTLVTFIIVFPFGPDIVYNSTRIVALKEYMKGYQHPTDSQLKSRIAMVGNFAPASNQCGFIVAEVRETKLSSREIRDFYGSILTNPSFDKEPPYQEVSLFFL